ncbi:MAG: succinate dehydrogenase / fumarate reductase, cytochrome b subunit [Actinomycetota bacterium]|nr:succinate dehydrogenase / fumarate reductase, cytochrome b subunit [Actinomycetota bacterium]
MLGPRIIEGIVFLLTIGAGLFALYVVAGLFRVRKEAPGGPYKGGVGQWSWAAHRITGVGVVAFLFGHIIDTFAAGFGPEAYDETIRLYKLWWFKPFEVALIGAVIYHAFNGLRIILFDFWPNLALKQKTFAYIEFGLVAAAFLPVAFFMLRSAFESSPFS